MQRAQMKRRVVPTIQARGLEINDDSTLVREGDAMEAEALQMTSSDKAAINRPMKGSLSSSSVIQRAIRIGGNMCPRTHETPPQMVSELNLRGLWNEFTQLNDDRGNIFNFKDRDHLYAHLMGRSGRGPISPPTDINSISPAEIQQGHERAQDQRFHTLFSATPFQIPSSAPGAHNIPIPMMPPPGMGHQWGRSPMGGGSEYTLYQHNFSGALPTQPLTYGDPSKPSMVMYQAGLNLGMHIQPAAPQFIEGVTRATSTYGGIRSEKGRVRGHPFALEQNQISTEDQQMTFDKDPRTYTDESDSTGQTGGTSSFRYYQVERPSFTSGIPFTQVNENPAISPMGIARPPTIRFRVQRPDGTFDDRLMDNTGTTDYRHAIRPKRVRQQEYQSQMGRQAAIASPYIPPTVRKPGEDFQPAERHGYPGYMSPPPTPFLGIAETIIVILDGMPNVGNKVHKLPNNRTGRVIEVLSRDKARNKSQCRVLLD
jgi:hypothetical protein